jgi:hypothetical protein
VSARLDEEQFRASAVEARCHGGGVLTNGSVITLPGRSGELRVLTVTPLHSNVLGRHQAGLYLYAKNHTYGGAVARGGSTVAIPRGRDNLDMESTPELEQVTEELPEYALLVDLPDE